MAVLDKMCSFESEQFSTVKAVCMREKIRFGQQSTKVKQLADVIEQDIMLGKYKTDTGLPSINHLSTAYHVSRDTVFKAFAHLKERKLIDSTPGKGYYVTNRQQKVFCCLMSILLSRILCIIVSSGSFQLRTRSISGFISITNTSSIRFCGK